MATLAETALSAGWVVHSFVLMGNHYHLLIETQRATLVKGMQYLNSTYTQRYNSRHKTRGHLFQGRYKALLVDAENGGYFLAVSDYIHLNPVRVRLHPVREAADLLKDPWSSAGWLTGSRKGRPEWLRWERVYGELGLGNWRSRARREYREHLARRMQEVLREEDERWKPIRREWCFGSEGFVDQMKEKLEDLAERPRGAESWAGEAVEEMEEDRAMRILEEGARVLGYRAGEKVGGVDRHILAAWARRRSKVSVEWLARRFGLKTRGGMSYSLRQVRKRMEKDRALQRKWKALLNHETRTDP
jgi:REP element-mobilizing transposase RayT